MEYTSGYSCIVSNTKLAPAIQRISVLLVACLCLWWKAFYILDRAVFVQSWYGH